MDLLLRTLRVQFVIFPVELTMIYAAETFDSKKSSLQHFYQFIFMLLILYLCDETGHHKLAVVLLKIFKTRYYCAIQFGLHDFVKVAIVCDI